MLKFLVTHEIKVSKTNIFFFKPFENIPYPLHSNPLSILVNFRLDCSFVVKNYTIHYLIHHIFEHFSIKLSFRPPRFKSSFFIFLEFLKISRTSINSSLCRDPNEENKRKELCNDPLHHRTKNGLRADVLSNPFEKSPILIGKSVDFDDFAIDAPTFYVEECFERMSWVSVATMEEHTYPHLIKLFYQKNAHCTSFRRDYMFSKNVCITISNVLIHDILELVPMTWKYFCINLYLL